jgi:hypothetical protein
MPWGVVDDKLHTHPKADNAGLAAMGLWALALSYCCDQLTDGFISRERVAKIAGGKPAGNKLAAALVAARLWHDAGADCEHPECIAPRPNDTGWRFHKWARYQRTRAVVEAERAKKAEAGRLGGQRKAANAGTSSTGLAGASGPPSSPPYSSPVPSPVPVPGPGDPGNSHTARSVGSTGDNPEPFEPLGELLRQYAEEGHPWSVKVYNGLPSQGGRLTTGQREMLVKIRDEKAAAPSSPSSSPKAVTGDERAVVELYIAGVKRHLREDRPELDRDVRAAGKLLADARRAAEHAASATAAGRWSPTWRDIAEHWIGAYLRTADRGLVSQGYPLSLLMSRIDPADLPRQPSRPERAGPDASTAIVEAAPVGGRYVGRPSFATEAGT